MTTIKYLKEAKNLQELKKLYFELAKKYHPDMSTGNLEIMKAINNEYDYLKTVLKNAADTERKHMETSSSMEGFKDIIEQLMKYPNITIQIVNKWLWISGKGTFAIKDEVLYNQLHCEYSRPQKKFYWYEGIENKEGKYKGGFLQKAIDKYGMETIISKGQGMPQLI